MTLSPLTAISPIDGRYRKSVEPLADYFSEAALIRYRVRVEIEYFIALCQLPLPPLAAVASARFSALRSVYQDFGPAEAAAVKEIERQTNHDVKAVEYFLKARFDALGLGPFKEFVHFGLTSQDVNNTAQPLALKEAWLAVLAPLYRQAADALRARALEWRDVPMLARTHGQPASPTILGKEIQVFVERLEEQMALLAGVPFAGKFGGATGNFNAHAVAYPEVDWPGFADRLLHEVLGLKRCRVTTQIEHYDHLAAFCDGLRRLNTILLDFDRDVWAYISLGYFRQKIKPGEVGSSTMPHKVNPIDFENSEGNLGVANALLAHLAAKLPISRLQRDLTDSTVTRNIGVPLAHTVIALKSMMRGLDKLLLDEAVLDRDLEANWAVVAEGIQTVLRREGFPNPYEVLKDLTRAHRVIDRRLIETFIENLDISAALKTELKRITPQNYTGVKLI